MTPSVCISAVSANRPKQKPNTAPGTEPVRKPIEATIKGDTIVTAGTISARLPSPFPRGIPIGAVKRVEGEGELDRTIHVKPYADLRVLDFVQVLTQPAADLRAAATP